MVSEYQRHHRLAHRHRADADARVVTALRANVGFLSEPVDRGPRREDRRRRLDGEAHDDVLPRGDPAEDAARVIGCIPRQPVVAGPDFVGVVLAGKRGRREAIAEAMSDVDTKTIIVWGVLANVLGIGFAAFADIWVSGLTFMAAFAGEFVPAAGPNVLFAILLAPLLYGAWKQAQMQSGR